MHRRIDSYLSTSMRAHHLYPKDAWAEAPLATLITKQV
jgi:hypothetical protein